MSGWDHADEARLGGGDFKFMQLVVQFLEKLAMTGRGRSDHVMHDNNFIIELHVCMHNINMHLCMYVSMYTRKRGTHLQLRQLTQLMAYIARHNKWGPTYHHHKHKRDLLTHYTHVYICTNLIKG